MWRINIAFLAHRCAMLLAIVSIAYIKLGPWGAQKIKSTELPPPIRILIHEGIERLSKTIEIQSQRKAIESSNLKLKYILRQPFPHFALSIHQITGIPYAWVAILLSNIILLLFLLELHNLASHMILSNAARLGTILVLFLPSSFLLSLGSSLPLHSYFFVLSISAALRNRWLTSGISFAFLAAADPKLLVLLPLLVFIFVFFHLRTDIGTVLKRGAVLFATLGVFLALDWSHYLNWSGFLDSSSLVQAFSPSFWSTGANLGMGLPLFIVAAYALGTVMLFLSSHFFIHRIVCVYAFLVFLFRTPISSLYEDATFGGLALVGVAILCSHLIAKIILVTLLGWGIYDLVHLMYP